MTKTTVANFARSDKGEMIKMTVFDKAWKIVKGEEDERFRGLPESPDYGFSPEHAWKEGVISPQEALQICEAGGCVWLKDYADENYGDEDNPHYDYPVEDPDDILTWMEEGMFEGPNAPIILTDPSRSFDEPNSDLCPECDVLEGDGSCSDCLIQQREEGRYEELWDE